MSEKVKIIKELSSKHDVKLLCRVFGVSRSTYYAALNRSPSKRQAENDVFKQKIMGIYTQSKQRYGCIKIKYALEKQGIFISQNRVLRLMRQLGIRSVICKKFRKRSREADKCERPNLLNRRFHAEKPNKIWLSDITYIKTHSGWTYLAAVLDMCTRKVVGYSFSTKMTADLTIDALTKACRNQGFLEAFSFTLTKAPSTRRMTSSAPPTASAARCHIPRRLALSTTRRWNHSTLFSKKRRSISTLIPTSSTPTSKFSTSSKAFTTVPVSTVPLISLLPSILKTNLKLFVKF